MKFFKFLVSFFFDFITKAGEKQSRLTLSKNTQNGAKKFQVFCKMSHSGLQFSHVLTTIFSLSHTDILLQLE